MKKLIIAIILTLLSISITLNAGDTFNITTVNGKKLTLEGRKNGILVKQYKGKIIFIEFWGTWCGPCLFSIPRHYKLQEKYKNNLRIIAFETTPDLSKDKLKEFVKNSNNIDMSKVQWFLEHKANSPAAKKYFQKPLKELQEFKKANKALNYDVVAYDDGKDFINYIAYRANWRGAIPFLLIFDQSGKIVTVIPGMPNEEKLENIINNLLININNKSDTNSTDNNTTK